MSQTLDFDALFQALPTPHMVLDHDLRYVAANDAYLAVTERGRETLLGRHVFENFPNEDEGGRLLKASLERVLRTGRAESIAFVPYAIPKSAERGGGFEMRYWTLVHTPLLADDGKVGFIVQTTVDVTELQRSQGAAEDQSSAARIGEGHLLLRAAEVQQVNASLVRETDQLRELFMQAPGFMAVLAGPTLIFHLANKAMMEMVGDRPILGRPVVEALPELVGQAMPERLAEVMRTRQPFIGKGLPVKLQRTLGAALEERFVDFVYQPMLDAEGQAWGVFVEGVDITDRVQAERQQKLLIDELNHRVKNTLATVQSIAAQTMRTTPDPARFRVAFEARLLALSATHDLLTASAWRGAPLRDVIEREFRPHGTERYSLDGPPLDMSPVEALALGLLFHELTTNAAKHGALSSPDGCVRVSWTVKPHGPGRRLRVTWSEHGGPKVAGPTRRGFGSRLIERSLKGEIGGSAHLDFHEDGVVCRISLPLKDED